jgi:hypothetical protein
LKQIKDKNDDCENKKNVNPRAERRATDQANDPEKKENDGDRPEHLGESPVAEPLLRLGVCAYKPSALYKVRGVRMRLPNAAMEGVLFCAFVDETILRVG